MIYLTDVLDTRKLKIAEKFMPRPKAYDPDEAVNRAMLLFWTEGFESTSIPQLEKHLGINRFSIYDSFSSKRQLFLRSLDAYTVMLVDTLVTPLEAGTNGLRDVERFLAKFRKLFLSQETPRGCLLCNTAVELGGRDTEIAGRVEAYFERIESAVFNCLLRARELGELASDKAMLRDRARATRLCFQGILVDIRLGKSPTDVRRSLTAMTRALVGR